MGPPAGATDGGIDKGIEVGEGVFIQPAPGYTSQKSNAGLVVLVKGQGSGFVRAEVLKDPGKIGTVLLPAIAKDQERQLALSDFSIREGIQVLRPKNPKLAYMGSIPWSGTASSGNKSVALEGYTTVIERRDHVFSMVTFFCPRDQEPLERHNRDAMLESIVASQ